MHLRNRGFSSCEGMLLEPPFIRRLLGVWMLLGWLLSSRELAALDDNFLGRSTIRFVVQLMYSASTAKGLWSLEGIQRMRVQRIYLIPLV